MFKCIIIIYRTASDPELNTISCSMCRRELGVWNFISLAHSPTEQGERQGHNAPSYLDTGQMFREEGSPGQISDQEESCDRSSSHAGGAQETVSDDNDDESNAAEAEKSVPMEEGGSFDRAERSSTEDAAMEKEYEPIETSNTLTVKPLELMGVKSPLHRSLSNLPGGEATESLCVEVENESLSERLQDVEAELEYLGCGREGMPEREDDGPRAKKRRLQVHGFSYMYVELSPECVLIY